jgi:hypothetical protein
MQPTHRCFVSSLASLTTTNRITHSLVAYATTFAIASNPKSTPNANTLRPLSTNNLTSTWNQLNNPSSVVEDPRPNSTNSTPRHPRQLLPITPQK